MKITEKAVVHNVTGSILGHIGRAPSPSSATYYCGGYWKSMGLYIGPWQAATAHVNVGLCWNGYSVWLNWGPDCPVSTNPLMGADTTWCGVYNNHGSYADPGSNFYIYAYSTPWWKRYGYMRFNVYNNGSASNPWGSCCS